MEILLYVFIALFVASSLSIAFLFLTKNPKVQNTLFYIVAILGMLIAFMTATGYPSNYIIKISLAWFWGILSIVAIIIRAKNPSKELFAKFLATTSVILGLIQLFFF